MGNKRLSEDEKMVQLRVNVPGWMLKKLQEKPNKSAVVRKLLEDYFKKEGK